MSTPGWTRVKELFEAALNLPPEARAAFLDAHCAGDVELRAEVEALLRAEERTGDTFLVPPQPAQRPPAQADLRPSSWLGEFELQEEIGRGGMGVVYRARQRGLERFVAVKVLLVGVTTTQHQLDRFHRESRAAAKLLHPGIVPIFTTGRTLDAHYFSMEYVSGGDLAAELSRQRKRVQDPAQSCRLPAPGDPEHVEHCARAIADLADAVQYAHEHGVVHRDVKPQNILLGDEGRFMLVDFGLAKDESQGSLSRSGEIIGTPHYMSPEQAQARGHAVDHRTDVYSLGAVLYEMLTLRRPFHGHSVQEVISQILHRDPEPLRHLNPRVPRDLAVVCATAMEKVRQERYATAAAFAADLRRFLRFESVEARPPGLVRRTRVFARRHALPLSAGSLLLLGLVGGASWTTRAAEERQRSDLLGGLRELELVSDWNGLDDEQLRDRRRALQSLALEAEGQERELVTRLEQRYDDLRNAWHDEALHRIEGGKRRGSPDELGGVDDAEVLSGVLLLTRALKIFPEDPELFALASIEAFHPRVSIRAEDEAGNALPGRATYRELDQVTGVPGDGIALGTLPVEARAIPPGFYRFVVELEGGDFREFTRLLRRAEDPPPIVCRVRAGQDPLEGMHLVAAETVRFPKGPRDHVCPLLERELVLAAFWIDETEVSVASYRAFLADTGHEPPAEWQWLPADELYDRRPAVAVSWYDALAYAEWAGKRLVAHSEWELAARGSEYALFDDPVVPYRGTCSAPDLPGGGEEECFRRYLTHTTAVDAPAEARGRNGLVHMLGNVFEWTESLGFEPSDAGPVPRQESRIVMSSPWYAAAREYSLATHRLWGPGRSYASADTGFRCARSASP